jgi:hypothetical protein
VKNVPLPLILVALAAGPAAGDPAKTMRGEEAAKYMQQVDDRRVARSDITREFYLEETLGKQKIIREGSIYVRTEDAVILFDAPRSERGNGILRSGRNLWTYNARVGKWERRTERDRLAGTNMRRSDFANARLTDSYDVEHAGAEMLKDVKAQIFVLTARKDADVPFARLKMWVNDEYLELKREEYGESGRLMRTSYNGSPVRLKDETGRELVLPGQMWMYDAVEKDRVTTVRYRNYSLKPIEQNVFTKAWLESKSVQ